MNDMDLRFVALKSMSFSVQSHDQPIIDSTIYYWLIMNSNTE